MVIGVVVLDAVFFVLKNRLAVDAWPEQRRLLFTGVWMVATLAVVLPTLAGIRATRTRARQARSGGRR